MKRVALPAAAVLALAAPAAALVVAARPVAQRALAAEVAAVGTVTAVEPDPVVVAVGNPDNKVTFRVAVVTVDEPLAGTDAKATLRVGFVPRPATPPAGPVRPPVLRRGVPDLKVGDRYAFFLEKNPAGGFYTMPFASPPLDVSTDAGKAELAEAKRALAVVADPLKALKAEKAEDRAFAAAALVFRYRSFPEAGGDPAETLVGAEESRLILKGLADGDWSRFERTGVNPVTAFHMLGLTPADGWTPPPVRPTVPGGQPVNFNLELRGAFDRWRDGPGRDYRVRRVTRR